MKGTLIFKSGKKFEGTSFGAEHSVSGELVFTTGMTGYPEALTDPSYRGQILVFTYPLLGSYGVPHKKDWESGRVQAAGVIVSDYIDTPSHADSAAALGEWLKDQGVPALIVKDTRLLAEMIRTAGSVPGKIVIGKDVNFEDPNKRNLVAEVARGKVRTEGSGKKHLLLLDCGAKANIGRELLARGVRLTTAPFDHDVFAREEEWDGIVISNGPGDPKMADGAIAIAREAIKRKIPILGICLGNQILALAAGGDTYKLKFGHRSQNQPCVLKGTERAYLTTQNHGYAVGKVPRGFKEWFTNANDGTNEGLIHEKLPFMSVQFHPEATPGPADTSWVFDYFLSCL